jgi:hypothetical protein
LLAGCAKPANVQTNLDISNNTVAVKVKNQDAMATTPLLVNVSVQFHKDGKWTEPDVVLHPAGFVLKGHEEQILHALVKPSGDAIKAKITIKEQESGRVISNQELEKPLTL